MTQAPTNRRRKQRKGVPNKLDPALAEALAGDGTAEWGPCMKALSRPAQSIRACAVHDPARLWGECARRQTRRIRNIKEHAKSWSVIAARFAHDEKVLAALHEEDQKRIRASAPRAIRALQHLIEDPEHKDHARGIGMVLDRVHPAETRHTVDVVHHVDHDAEAIAQLRMLKQLDVPRAKLEAVFGFTGLSRYERLLDIEDAKRRPEPRLIEGTATELKDAS